MVHAYQKGKLKHAPAKVREIASHISEDDAKHFAKTRHDGLPERRDREEEKAAAYVAGFLCKCAESGVSRHVAEGMLKLSAFMSVKGFQKEASVFRKIKNAIEFHRFLRKYDTTGNFRALLHGKDRLPRYSHSEVRRILPRHPVFRGAAKDPVHISGMSPSIFGPDKLVTTAGDGVVKPENVVRSAHNMRHVTPNLTWSKWYINDMSKSNGLVSVYDMQKIPELMSGATGFYEDWGAAKSFKNGTFYKNPSSARAAKNLRMTDVMEQTRRPKPKRLPKANAGYYRPETLLDVTKNQPDMVFSIPDDRFQYIDMTSLLDVMRPKQTIREKAMARLARMKMNKALNGGKVGNGIVNELHRNYNIPVFE